VTCLNPDCRLNRFDKLIYGAGSQYIWMDAGNQGRAMPVRMTGSGTGEVFDYYMEVPRLYRSGDRMVGRFATYRGEPYYIFEETLFFRIPSGSLDGAWELPPCYDEEGNPFDVPPSPCNNP